MAASHSLAAPPRGEQRTQLVMHAYQRHGEALLRLAAAVTGGGAGAESAVVDAIKEGCSRMDCAEPADERRLRHELARLTYWGCIRSGVTGPAGEAGLPSAPEVTRHVPAPAKRGLDALPDKERAAIALCLYGAHTYQEAADLLALPAEAVAHLLSLGLRKVGPLLEASQPAPGGHSAD